PKITLAPLFILALGIGLLARVGIVFIEVFFVVFYNTLKGVVEVNEDHVNIARIMGASRYRVARRIIMPSALPSILVGLKVGVPFAMIGAILGEYIASNQGLGWLILYSSNSFDSSGTWSAILFLVATTWALGQILATIERRVLRLRRQRRGRGMEVGWEDGEVTDAVIKYGGVVKRFGSRGRAVTALQDVTQEIRENEFTSIVGPS